MRGRVRILVVFIFALMSVSILQVANRATGSAGGYVNPMAVTHLTTGTTNGAYFDHVVVIMLENHDINYTYGLSVMPNSWSSTSKTCLGNCTYFDSLADSNGLAKEYTDGGIPGSIQDYIAITSGYGNTPQACNSYVGASGCPLLQIPNIVDRLEGAGLSWRAYMEGYPVSSGCYNNDAGSPNYYTFIHNPFIYYSDIQNNATRCSHIVNANSQHVSQSGCWPTAIPKDDLFLNDLNSPTTSPNYLFLTPNNVDDAHDCNDVSVSNAWLNEMVPQILDSSVFKTERAALFITFDEPGCTYTGCPSEIPELYSVWASNPTNPTTGAGFKSSTPYTHYSPLKTIEANWNLASLTSNDASATPMTEFFNPPPSPDFSISTNPTSLNVQAGSTSNSKVTVTSLNNFAGTITLSATGSPAGLNLSLSPSTVTLSPGGTSTSTLSVGSANPGSYTITTTGTSGTLSHQTTVTVNVVDFSMTGSPSSVTISPGSSAGSSVSLKSLGGFVGTITLSTTSSPPGPTLSLSSSTVTLSSGGTGTTTLTISTQSSTPAGNYNVTVTGSSGSLSHSTSVLVSVKTVPDFSIVANPTLFTLQPGASSSSTITVTSLNGFTGTVSLTDGISPATSNPPVISLSSSRLTLISGGSAVSTLSITTSSSTTSGSYTILVTGTSGSLLHSVSLSLTVAQPADFSLASSSSTVNILAGSSRTPTITAASVGGFSGTVSLSISAGTRLTTSVNPTSLALNSGGTATSTLTLTSGAIGNYTVTVTGTSGSLVHSVSVLVVVSDFSISISPSSLSLPRDTSGTSLITLTSLNGFAGTVTLSTAVSPIPGPRTSLSNPSVTLTPGGQSTSTLNVRAQHKTPPGTYTVTITAVSGSLTHTVTVVLTVS